MSTVPARSLGFLAAAGLALLTTAFASGHSRRLGRSRGYDHGLTARTILGGLTLTHTFTAAGAVTASSEPLSDPDDITRLGSGHLRRLQNGVGPQGQASPSGNLDSTIVEMSIGRAGRRPVGHRGQGGRRDR